MLQFLNPKIFFLILLFNVFPLVYSQPTEKKNETIEDADELVNCTKDLKTYPAEEQKIENPIIKLIFSSNKAPTSKQILEAKAKAVFAMRKLMERKLNAKL